MTKGGIVGFGMQGKLVFQAMKQLGIEVVAVCDVNPEAFQPGLTHKRKILGSPYPEQVDYGDKPPNFYTNWNEMLSQERLDIVTVVTWTRDHSSVVEQAAQKGVKAILCEKPISNCLVTARRMINICEANKVVLAVNHTRRWWSEHRQIRKLIQGGVIGELRHLWLSCGGARLGDLSVHFIDWMRWITNRNISSVIGFIENIDEPNPRGSQFQDPPGRLYLDFGDIDGLIHLGRNIALPPRYEIVGTKGRILIEEHQGINDRWEIHTRPESRQLTATLDYYGKIEPISFQKSGKIEWVGMIVSALQELLQGKTSCPGEDGYKAVEALVATYVSHKNRHMPVKLPLAHPEYLSLILPIA